MSLKNWSYDVRDVALWFLSIEEMNFKKLSALCFYAQAWYCALHQGEEMYHDEIVGYLYGPKISSLYSYLPVRERYLTTDRDVNFVFSKFDKTLPEYPGEILSVLNFVWSNYSNLSGNDLSRLSRSETPYQISKGTHKPSDCEYEPITAYDLHSFYSKRLNTSTSLWYA